MSPLKATSYKPQAKGGYTLIEALLYVTILAILLVILTMALSGLFNSQRKVRATLAIEASSQAALERISREIRDANTVDTITSVLGTSPGSLSLITTDSAGLPRVVEFFVSNSVIRVKEDTVDVGPLTYDDAEVTNLIFRRIDLGGGEAIKIEMTIESGTSTSYRTADFYSTVILRDSY